MDYSTEFIKCESEPRLYRCPLCCCMEFYTKEDFHRHLTSVVARLNDLQCDECQQGFPSLQEYTEHFLMDCKAVGESSVDCDAVVIKQEQADCIQYMVVEDTPIQPTDKTELNQAQEHLIEKRRPRKSNLVPRKFIESSNDVEPQKPPSNITTQNLPSNIAPQNPPSNITPQNPPSNITPQKPPSNVTPQEPPSNITPQQPPSNITTQKPPSNITPQNPPSNITPQKPPSNITTQKPPSNIAPRQQPPRVKISPAKKGKITKKPVVRQKKKKDVAGSSQTSDTEFESYFVPTEPAEAAATTVRQSKMPSSFCCEYCGKILKRNDDYIKHVRVHTGEKPCVCVVCGKRFRVMCGLTLHMRTHTNERPYSCSICPLKFKSHSQLNFHVQSHSEERNYQCPYCEKKFKTICVLASHKKHHFKTLECELCHRTFSTNNLLKKHHRLVHSETGQEFKCSLCGFAFGKAWILENHLKSHHSDGGVENSESESENGEHPLDCFMDVNILEPVAAKRVRKQKLMMDM